MEVVKMFLEHTLFFNFTKKSPDLIVPIWLA